VRDGRGERGVEARVGRARDCQRVREARQRLRELRKLRGARGVDRVREELCDAPVLPQ
jgi:hypothetical protein